MGLFDEDRHTPASRQAHRTGGGKDTSLFDWLVKKAEADLGLAQAFAASECDRAEHIKNLEASLIGQISALQQQVVESREAELNALKSDLFACANRLERVESQAGDATKAFVQDNLGALRAQFSSRQTELETRHSSFEKLSQSLGAQIRALEEQIRRELTGVDAVRAELHHWQSEAKSLTERVGQAESTAWQSRALASRNVQQLEQTVNHLESGIAALHERFNELNERQRNAPQAALLVKQIAESLGTRIEDILARLAEQHQAQVERDDRLAGLDAGLAAIVARVTQTESTAEAAYAMLRRESGLTSDLRDQVSRELATICTQLGELQARVPTLESLDSALRVKLEAWQERAEQKFVLIENRWIEQEKTLRELGTDVDTKLAATVERAGEQLQGLTSGYERLLSFEPTMRTLEQRIAQLEIATQGARDHSKTVTRLEEDMQTAVDGLRAELTSVKQQQRSFRLVDEEIAGIERKLGLRVDDLQRQMNVERDGLEHWSNGLRDSLGAELGAMQARLSERQTQVEYDFTRLDQQLNEKLTTAVLDFETKVNERLRSHEQGREQSATLGSALEALASRAHQLEARSSEIENRVDSRAHDLESRLTDLCGTVAAIRTHVNQLPAMSVASVTEGLEETLHAALRHLEEQVNEKFSRAQQSDNERAEQTDATIDDIIRGLQNCQALVTAQQSEAASAERLARDVEQSLATRILSVEQRFVERCAAIDDQNLEHERRAHETAEALHSQVAAVRDQITTLQVVGDAKAEVLTDSAVLALQESFGASIQDMRQHIAHQLEQQDQRHSEHVRQTERLIDALRAEITALHSGAQDTPQSIAATALREFEEAVSAKVQDLRHEITQKLDYSEQRDGARSQEAERLIAGVSAEIAAIKSDLSQAAATAPNHPGLDAVEGALRAKIDELSQQVMEQRGLSEQRDGVLGELSDRFQSLMERVAQLSEAIHDPKSVGPSTAHVAPLPPRPTNHVAHQQDALPASHADAIKHEPPSEKEQMVKLQERMSAEIERVRAELKERSGRWKVRRNAS